MKIAGTILIILLIILVGFSLWFWVYEVSKIAKVEEIPTQEYEFPEWNTNVPAARLK